LNATGSKWVGEKVKSVAALHWKAWNTDHESVWYILIEHLVANLVTDVRSYEL
jgi:hypothetical protein